MKKIFLFSMLIAFSLSGNAMPRDCRDDVKIRLSISVDDVSTLCFKDRRGHDPQQQKCFEFHERDIEKMAKLMGFVNSGLLEISEMPKAKLVPLDFYNSNVSRACSGLEKRRISLRSELASLEEAHRDVCPRAAGTAPAASATQ